MRTPLNEFFLESNVFIFNNYSKDNVTSYLFDGPPLYHAVKRKTLLLIKKITIFEIKTGSTFNRFSEAKLSYLHED